MNIALWRAKRQYAREEREKAYRLLLNSKLAAFNAANARKEVEALRTEAQAIDDSIKAMLEKEEKGYWLCENGHERQVFCGCAGYSGIAIVHVQDCPLYGQTTEDGKPTDPSTKLQCSECGQFAKFISGATMSGQEKYESDKERKDAETIAQLKRDAAKQKDEFAESAEGVSKAFRQQAEGGLKMADKIAHL